MCLPKVGQNRRFEQLDLLTLGFEVKTLKKEGRPSFESATLLKIYLYGYLNGFRSSRRVETECFVILNFSVV